MMAKYDMVPRYLDTAAYRKAVEELISSEQAALDKIGLAQKGLKRPSANGRQARKCQEEEDGMEALRDGATSARATRR